MIEGFFTFLLILTALSASAILARKLTLAPAIVFLLVGIALALVPVRRAQIAALLWVMGMGLGLAFRIELMAARYILRFTFCAKLRGLAAKVTPPPTKIGAVSAP